MHPIGQAWIGSCHFVTYTALPDFAFQYFALSFLALLFLRILAVCSESTIG